MFLVLNPLWRLGVDHVERVLTQCFPGIEHKENMERMLGSRGSDVWFVDIKCHEPDINVWIMWRKPFRTRKEQVLFRALRRNDLHDVDIDELTSQLNGGNSKVMARSRSLFFVDVRKWYALASEDQTVELSDAVLSA